MRKAIILAAILLVAMLTPAAIRGSEVTVTCAFADGVLPEGWELAGGAAISSGALQLSNPGDVLKTTEYSDILRVEVPMLVQKGKFFRIGFSSSGVELGYEVLIGDGKSSTLVIESGDAEFSYLSGVDNVSIEITATGASVYSISVTYEYTPPVAPEFSVAGGTYNEEFDVTLTTTTTGGKIRYTTDGSAPTGESAGMASGGVLRVDRSMTVRAVTELDGAIGPEGVADYELQAPAPTLVFARPADGGKSAVTVSAVEGATPQYRTAAGSWEQWTAPIEVAEGVMVEARAVRDGWTDSQAVDGTYAVHDFSGGELPEGWTLEGGATIGAGSVVGGACVNLDKERQTLSTRDYPGIWQIGLTAHGTSTSSSSSSKTLFMMDFYDGANKKAQSDLFSLSKGQSAACLYGYGDDALLPFFPESGQAHIVFLGTGVEIPSIFVAYSTGGTYGDDGGGEGADATFVFGRLCGTDDAGIGGAAYTSGGITLTMPAGATYAGGTGEAVISQGGAITVSAPLLLSATAGVTSGTVEINGQAATAWEGHAREVTITATGGEARLAWVDVAEAQVIQLGGDLGGIADGGQAGTYYETGVPLQGVIEGRGGMLQVRTTTAEACSQVWSNGKDTPGADDDDEAAFVQRDWTALDLTATGADASAYVGHIFPPGIIGRMADISGSPVLEALILPEGEIPGSGDDGYNTYAPRNFYGAATSPDGNEVFVVRARVNEYATVRGAIEDDGTGGYVVTSADGRLKIDNSLGVVTETSGGVEMATQGVILTADGESDPRTILPEGKEYLFLATGKPGVVTGVTQPTSDGVRVTGGEGVVTVTAQGKASADVYDSFGRIVARMGHSGTIQLPRGFYIVKVAQPGSADTVRKVMVK